MPHKNSAGLQNTRELRNYASIVRGTLEEAKRCKEIHHTVKPIAPNTREAPHICSAVFQ